MKAQITLRSGVQLLVDAESIDTGRDRLEGRLVRMSWETPENWTAKLHTVDVGEIVAIVLLRDGEVTT